MRLERSSGVGEITIVGGLERAINVWIDANRFVTANEGDWKGGSRGFTIFNKDGSVAYESGASLEHEIVALGHYPDKRNKKGAEIEGIEAARFGNDNLIFVASERASMTIAIFGSL